MYQFNLRTIIPFLRQLPDALLLTLWLSLLTILLSLAVGLAGALARTNSRSSSLRALGVVYVEVFRNVPLLVVLYLVYFGFAQIGWQLGAFYSALTALTLNSGAYMTEIFRGGLLAIPRGQYEAAAAQGMTVVQTLRHIILPQVFRVIYAPLGNQFVGVILGSSLASVIAVPEVTAWMKTAGAVSFRFFETFVVAGALYVTLCQIINVARILTGRRLFRAEASGGRP